MRIARIIEYFPPHIGGMERHGLILSQEQVKLGHDVEIFIGVGSPSLFKKTFKASLQFLPLYSKARRFCFNFWAYFVVKRQHKKNPYDIIHLHGDFVEAYFGGKLSKKLGVPAVLTIHAGLNKKRLKQKNRKFFDNISKIICVSEEIGSDLKSIGAAKDKIRIITSGICLDEFKNVDKNKIMELRDKYTSPIIISVGVLRINKGLNYLISAFKEVLNKFNSATLLIIGDGPEKSNLKRQSENISNIHFLGRQEHNEVVAYLYASGVFVLASISTYNDREGTSTVVMEAMAAGLPVIITKVGGNPYLVKDGVNGFLVGPGNSLELAEAITKLLNNREISQKMSAQNLEDIKQKDWLVIAKKIIKIYQSLL